MYNNQRSKDFSTIPIWQGNRVAYVLLSHKLYLGHSKYPRMTFYNNI